VRSRRTTCHRVRVAGQGLRGGPAPTGLQAEDQMTTGSLRDAPADAAALVRAPLRRAGARTLRSSGTSAHSSRPSRRGVSSWRQASSSRRRLRSARARQQRSHDQGGASSQHRPRGPAPAPGDGGHGRCPAPENRIMRRLISNYNAACRTRRRQARSLGSRSVALRLRRPAGLRHLRHGLGDRGERLPPRRPAGRASAQAGQRPVRLTRRLTWWRSRRARSSATPALPARSRPARRRARRPPGTASGWRRARPAR
jgi:hypothetical protein